MHPVQTILGIPFICLDLNRGGVEHVHSFDTEWIFDATGHWHAATCGHDVKGDFAPHTLESRIDDTSGDVKMYEACTVCGYETDPIDTEETVYQATLDGTQYETIEAAVSAYNDITEAGTHTIIINNGRYVLQDVVIKQTVNNKGLTIQAASKGGVSISAGEGTNTHSADEAWGIFKLASDSSYNDESPIIIKDINFELLNTDGSNVCAIYCSGDSSERYTGNITLSGCSFVGLPDESYAMQGGSNTGNRNITIVDCYAENVRGLYQGVATPLTIEDCVLKNCKSIVNRQNQHTPKADGSYDLIIRNVSGNIMFEEPDSIYAIRSEGGRTLIEGCNIVFDYKTASDDTSINGLLVLRSGTHEVEIKDSVLTANTIEGSGGKAYVIYSPSGTVSSITSESSTLNGEVYPDLTIN